ncbi:peptidase M4 family protein [Pseudoalteromonas sp. KS88]|uniref:M4 family metallopeptidase n=1 Tax=Pseudoalteromonas sp. KS88 TaxID=2109918 RepID=UPI0010811CC8|nr:M4 family metallopeptidase [Pseudoalteromonas sp. KS88]TGE84840.1 peptidase M4 family protein [Pseudoalteromonas sp. KS88]
MYKSLSLSLIAFSLLNSFSTEAAISQRVTKSSSPEVQTLLTQNLTTAQSSNKSYFVEVEGVSSHRHKPSNTLAVKKMQQYFAGVPVWGQQIRVKPNNNHISGFFAKNIEASALKLTANTEFEVSLAADALLQNAKLGTDSTFELLSNERYIYIDNEQAHYVRLIELIVHEQMNEYRPIALVSESNYRIFKQWNNIQSAHGKGPGGNIKTGQYEYGTDFEALDITQVDDVCFLENEKVKTVTMESGNEPSEAFSFPCDRNTHKEINGAYSPLNDAHAFGTAVFDMYQQWYNTAPLTFQLLMRVHNGDGWENATWNGAAMTFGDGADNFHPLVSLDIVSHEVSHGFTQQNSDLLYFDQSGGINESFSDMAGETAEYFLRGQTDWLSGADISKVTPALRYFETPSLDGYSIDNASDFLYGMDVHYSSGVFNRAFYFLSNTEGWDPRKAFEIMLNANQNYWVNSTDFIDGACGAINSAIDLSYNAVDVINAFQIVGIQCDNIQFIDTDADSMDDNWELVYGLNPNSADDASLDLDLDGLSNLEEYLANTYPNDSDSDNDGLSDFDELNTYLTQPTNADSDADVMPDGWEVSFALNPLDGADAHLDLDDDSFTNVIEFIGGSDPSDSNSLPSVLEQAMFNFDDGQVPSEFISSNVSMPWLVTEVAGSQGFALTNNDIGDAQQTSIKFNFLSAEQLYLNFTYMLVTEVGFDFLRVYLNDELILEGSGLIDWTSFSAPIASGLNELTFTYSKDGSVSTDLDAVFIDNIHIGTEFSDTDNDGMADSWELLHGLDIYNSEDAALDFDEDGLSNLLEFLNGGLPRQADTDSDSMPDGWEYNNGLRLTDALDALEDPDNDGFDNQTEYFAQTDPQLASSYPESLNISSSFEAATLPQWITHSEDSSAPWFITNGFATDGEQSIRAGNIDDSQFSQFTISGLFAKGIFTFDYKLESESCCDNLFVLMDGIEVFTSRNRNDSATISVKLEIPGGLHQLSFKYNKDSSASTGEDTVWLDNFIYFSETDLTDSDDDQLPDYWELKHGLDRLDPSDALSDLDDDGLSALDEFNLGTNPSSGDSDNDELADGYEVMHNLLPLDASDANFDADNDSFTNLQEFYAQSSASDSTSTPQRFEQLNESFEEGRLPNYFTELALNIGTWESNTHWSTADNASLALSQNDARGIAGFAIAGVFSSGFITLDYQTNYTNLLEVSVNGTVVEAEYSTSRLLLPVSEGYNIVKVKFDLDLQYSQGVSFDNVIWFSELDTTADFDSDGLPDYWEYENGLNALYSYDANDDLDYDGLSNLEEFNLQTNPRVRDSDADGVYDSEDSHPNDASLGENQAPIFGNLEPITIEAEFESTYIPNVFLPQVTDNGHLEPQVYIQNGSSYPLGEHQISWVARDFVGNETTAIQTVTIVDTTPPAIREGYYVSFYGNTLAGLKDAISNNYVIDEAASGISSLEIDSSFIFRTGNVQVPVTVTDGAGNSTTGNLMARIYPEVSIQPHTQVYQNGKIVVDLFIHGESPSSYASFSLNMNNQNYYFYTYLYGPIKVELERPSSQSPAIIKLNGNSNVFVGKNDTSTLVYLEEQASPTLTVDLRQNGKVINKHVQRSLNDFFAEIKILGLPSSTSQHDLELEVSPNIAFTQYHSSESVWTINFDPNTLDGDIFELSVTGKVDNEVVVSKVINLQVIDDVSFDDREVDTDGDGIPDFEEGLGDGDKDGIVDYLDNSALTHTAILASGDSVQSVDQFNHISVGTIKESSNNGTIANMSINEQSLTEYFPEVDIVEPHFQAKSDLVNLNITLANMASSAEIAIPQSVNSLLSSHLQVRVLSHMGWQSVPALTGNVYDNLCSGCVAFGIVDGGEFDLDGKVNGEIEVVAKLAEESLNQAPVLNASIPQSIDELTEVELDASGTVDPDGDTLTFDWKVEHPQLSISNTDTQGKVILNVAELIESTEVIVNLVISDGYEQFTHDFKINALHINQLPSVELSDSTITADEETEVTVTATATDKESTELIYTWIQTQGIEVVLENENTNTLKFVTPNVSQSTELAFKVVVSDGEADVEQAVTVTVNDVPQVVQPTKLDDKKSGGGSFALMLLLLLATLVLRRSQYSRYG